MASCIRHRWTRPDENQPKQAARERNRMLATKPYSRNAAWAAKVWREGVTKFWTTAAALVLLAICTTHLGGSEWTRDTAEDKRGHVAVGLATGLLVADLLRPARAEHPRLALGLSVAPVLALAIGKEVYDAQHRDRHTPEVRDALATILGGAVGLTVSYKF